ncbi:hypothetical protein HA466_0076800 [Hirschfeldia incana]|nr:hypothetical protein HA466_0076800 [Hirschfeldia incana]
MDHIKEPPGEATPIVVHLCETGSLPNGRALVPGCGTGYDVVVMANADRHVVGLELSKTSVERSMKLSGGTPGLPPYRVSVSAYEELGFEVISIVDNELAPETRKVSSQADHVMVIAGEWVTSGDGSWNFSIDKHQMSRIVTLSPNITLADFQNSVLKEFFSSTEPQPSASLSYWPPNTKELATGIKTPPVMLTHDWVFTDSQVGDNPFSFTTPNQPITKPLPFSTATPPLVPFIPIVPLPPPQPLKFPSSLFSRMMISLEISRPNLPPPPTTRKHAKF